MSKKKKNRFTPQLLERFKREGRGTGTYAEYIPWHRVGKGDPSSRGRSHTVPWRGRAVELLSDLELVIFDFVTMLDECVVDVREQFPLKLDDAEHELRLYQASAVAGNFPGTTNLARELKIKHPSIRGEVSPTTWIMSTDFLVTLQEKGGRRYLLAISCKYSTRAEKRRPKELLTLEREYWSKREVPWLLITEKLFDPRVGLSLRRVAPWAQGVPASHDQIRTAVSLARARSYSSYSAIYCELAQELGDPGLAQRAFWQAAWRGLLPVDLRLSWRPHVPLAYVSEKDFLALNPVASRRTAWT